MAPKPALARKASIRPKRSIAARTSCLLVVPARHVAAHREGALVAAELVRQLPQLVLRARRQHHPVAELRGPAGGRRADAGAGAGDHEDWFVGHRLGSIRRPVGCPACRASNRREARFPGVAAKAGHYESCYLKACHPSEPLGAWIRYTVHKRPVRARRARSGSRSSTRPPTARAPSKVTVPAPGAGGGDWIKVGEATLGPGRAVGSAQSDRCDASWDLTLRQRRSRRSSICRATGCTARRCRAPSCSAPCPPRASRAVSPWTAASWTWPAGAAWSATTGAPSTPSAGSGCTGSGFDGAGEGSWLDAAIGRIKIGPVTTPWIGNGALSVDGERIALGGPGRRVDVAGAPGRLRASRCRERTCHVRGTVESDRGRLRRLGLRGPGRRASTTP